MELVPPHKAHSEKYSGGKYGRAKLLLSRSARNCAMIESGIYFKLSAQQKLRPPVTLLDERHFFGRTLPHQQLAQLRVIRFP